MSNEMSTELLSNWPHWQYCLGVLAILLFNLAAQVCDHAIQRGTTKTLAAIISMMQCVQCKVVTSEQLLTPASSLAFATETKASNAASLVFLEGSLHDSITSPKRRDTNEPLVTISTALCFKTSEMARIRAGRAAADTEPTVDITRPITLADASAC